MTDEFDLEGFRRTLENDLKSGRENFNGKYAKEITQLAGLSREQIESIAPGISDLHTYDALITVVKAASRYNVANAELKAQIEKLGKIAVKIAKKVPGLAALF